jgi:arginyl-tRNA synthetase
MAAAVAALSGGNVKLDIKLCQLVNLFKEGQPYKMSKRAGTFVTARDIIDDLGKDVLRFMMLTRKNDIVFDFDIAKATEQSKDNPVFYVQYANARAHSVLRHAAQQFSHNTLKNWDDLDLSVLDDEAELTLIKWLAGFPRIVETAAIAHEPHRLTFYLYDIAHAFHALWHKGRDHAELRFIDMENSATTVARLALLQAMLAVLESGLALLGVTPVEEM